MDGLHERIIVSVHGSQGWGRGYGEGVGVRRVVLTLGITVSVALLGGCGGSESATTTTAPPATAAVPAPPYPVQTVTRAYEDPTRSTPATAAGPEHAGRSLTTTVVYPEVDRPSPLVVLSHGLGGSPANYSKLAEAWAAHGYVVALPAFPATNSSVPNPPAQWSDVQNQPDDVSFVIDQLLAESSSSPDAPLRGRIDPEHIGVAGHSLGGATSYGVSFAPCCRDDRVDAVVILSGLRLVEAGSERFDLGLPTLVFHGDADPTLPYRLGVDAYTALGSPKWLVTLAGAPHSTPYSDEDSVWDDVVRRTTLDFLDAELGGQADGLDRLRADAVVAGVSSLQAA